MPQQNFKRKAMNLIELARQHIQAENDHDVPATMATISENGADYKI
jgi:hypothetical protein